MKVLAVANPVSGKGKAKILLTNLINLAPFEVIPLIHPTAAQTSEQLRTEIDKGDVTDVVAIGGDGMVHLCLQEIAEKKIDFHVIAAGTGNDFAHTGGRKSKSLSAVVSQLSEGSSSRIDLGLVTYAGGKRWFGQVLSTGFDAIVNKRANGLRLIKGQMKYNIATILVLFRFKPIRYHLNIDGVPRTLDAMLISVANGPSYGGGMMICPMADRTDGLLDVIIIKPVSKFELLKVFPKVFSGSHVNHPQIEFLRIRSISIQAQTIAYADGEYISQLPISISVVPKALALAN